MKNDLQKSFFILKNPPPRTAGAGGMCFMKLENLVIFSLLEVEGNINYMLLDLNTINLNLKNYFLNLHKFYILPMKFL